MGFFRAVGRSYANMLNFSGRACRAEFWWFVLFQFLAIFGATFSLIMLVSTNPQWAAQFQDVSRNQGDWAVFLNPVMAWWTAGYIVLIWLPATASIVRRLHDTNRSGGWYFIQLVPLIGAIWLLVLLLLPGTHGSNRFGPDTVPDRKRRLPVHPAFDQPLNPRDRAAIESARRAEIKAYYRKTVLSGIQKSEA